MTRLSRSIVLLLLLWIATMASYAQTPGITAFEFLRIPMSARAASLGDAFNSATADPSVLFANPANLASLTEQKASIGFVKHLLDVNAGFVSYGRAIPDIGTVGGGIIYLNYGSMDRTDKNANMLGTFSAGDLAVLLSWARTTGEFRYGASAKFIYSSIDNVSASGVAVDLGGAWFITKENLTLSVSVLNLGMQTSSFGKDREALPLDVSIGGMKKLEHLPLTLFLQFHRLNEDRDNVFDRFSAFALGGEIQLSSVLKARLGYNNEMRRELKIGNSAGLAGFAAGLGIRISRYDLDYAFTSFGKIGSLHRISLSTSF